MEIRNDLMYTKSHEWIKEEGDLIVVGLTDYAQHELGDLVFVNLPEVGDDVEVEETFADVESVKAVSDVYSPVSGTVAESVELIEYVRTSSSSVKRPEPSSSQKVTVIP